jgi:hypothetical protein
MYFSAMGKWMGVCKQCGRIGLSAETKEEAIEKFYWKKWFVTFPDDALPRCVSSGQVWEWFPELRMLWEHFGVYSVTFDMEENPDQFVHHGRVEIQCERGI